MRTIIRYEETFDGVGVWMMVRDNKGKVSCARPVELIFEPVKEYPLLPDATLKFTSNSDGKIFLQEMANELVRLGFIPDLARRNDAEIGALKAHLTDLRHIVFNTKPTD